MIQNTININHTNIGKYLKDTAPYIFVDTAEIVPGKSGKGLKMWTHNEWFFKCHFPKNPIVPGVFQLEGIMQVAALAIHTLQDMDGCFVYAQKIKDFEIKKPIYPGQISEYEITILQYKRGIVQANGCAYVITNLRQRELSAEASFKLIVPNELEQCSPKKKG